MPRLGGPLALVRLDGQQLALVVPLVERGRLVEPLVALQADQLGAVDRGQRLGDLGLADARLAFEQQRALQQLHERQRRRQLAVGDVAGSARGAVRRSRRADEGSWRSASWPRYVEAAA